jgi:hypothetical protein
MTPPFTLFRLVVAPMTAPAAAPIAASRLVFFTTTSPDEVDVVTVLVPLDVPTDDEPDELDPELRVDVRRGADAVEVRRTVLVAGARTVLLLTGAVVLPASSELRVSVRGCCCAASDRSFCSDELSGVLSRLHPAASDAATRASADNV